MTTLDAPATQAVDTAGGVAVRPAIQRISVCDYMARALVVLASGDVLRIEARDVAYLAEYKVLAASYGKGERLIKADVKTYRFPRCV